MYNNPQRLRTEEHFQIKIETKIYSNIYKYNKFKNNKMVMYWAIELSLEEVIKNQQIKNFMASHPELVPLEKIHSTLLFVGRKKKVTNDNIENIMEELKIKEDPEEQYIKSERRECVLTVKQFGYSVNAMALDVDSIIFNDDSSKCPSNAIRQHVTMALANKTKAVDSVKTLLGEGTIEVLDVPLKLYGKVKGYNY